MAGMQYFVAGAWVTMFVKGLPVLIAGSFE